MKSWEMIKKEKFNEKEELYGMANLTKEDTGLNGWVYISTREGNHTNPRIKFYRDRPNKNDLYTWIELKKPYFPIHIDNINITKEEYNQLKKFLLKNYSAIEKFWFEGMFFSNKEVQDLINNLEKV